MELMVKHQIAGKLGIQQHRVHLIHGKMELRCHGCTRSVRSVPQGFGYFGLGSKFNRAEVGDCEAALASSILT